QASDGAQRRCERNHLSLINLPRPARGNLERDGYARRSECIADRLGSPARFVIDSDCEAAESGRILHPAGIDEARDLLDGALLFIQRDAILLAASPHDAGLELAAGDGQAERIIVAPEAPWCCTAKGGHARQEVFDHVQIANTSSWTRERERESRPPEACPVRHGRRLLNGTDVAIRNVCIDASQQYILAIMRRSS